MLDQERSDGRADAVRLGDQRGESSSRSSPDWVAAIIERIGIVGVSDDRPRKLAIAVAVVAISLIGAGLGLRACASEPEPVAAALFTSPPSSATPVSTTTTLEAMVIHAAGAVRAPGLYRLVKGSRIADVLEAAGGVADGADLNRVNLAALVSDSDRIYIPFIGVPIPGALTGSTGSGTGGGGAPDNIGPVDLNTATAEELEGLPGVGPATAAAIVNHRDKIGPFASVEDLLDVRGIGDAKLESLRDLVTAG
jgi:competence protein ComEA